MNPEKRNQLLLLVMVTGLSLVILYLTLITGLQSSLSQAQGALDTAQRKQDLTNGQVKSRATVLQSLERSHEALAAMRERLPSGEAYSWLLEKLDDIATVQGVKRDTVERPTAVDSKDIEPPAKGYGVLRGTCTASGSYTNLGQFVAAIENELPFLQVERTVLEAGARKGGGTNALALSLGYATVAPSTVIPGSR